MAELRLHNTLTRQVEPFVPLGDEEVKVYTCGLTVYDFPTIANMRAYLFADALRRTLLYFGYRPRHVINVTDVGHLQSDADEGEDKMLLGMRREGKTPWEIAAFYTEVFLRHLDLLSIMRPTVLAKATEHIPAMIELVKRIEERGYTYAIGDGLYFDISKFPHYGELSRLDLEGQEAGARVAVNPEKRHPADFALWRRASPEHVMQWDSPWGRGYPGWHVECSAMSMHYLGERFDIHTGGVDHIPVHHEAEIAQNEAATGHRVVERWMHNEFLLIDGGRMGKSLGNYYTLDDLAQRGYHPLSYRYFVSNAHYRSKLNFTWAALDAAQVALERLWQRCYELGQAAGGAAAVIAIAADAAALPSGRSLGTPQAERFMKAVGDDLNTAQGASVLWEVARGDALPAPEALRHLLLFDRVMALDLERAARGEVGPAARREEVPGEVMAMVRQREEARARRDWAGADALRRRLTEMGYLIEDTSRGPKVRRN